jgi:signal transduction histidine kinase
MRRPWQIWLTFTVSLLVTVAAVGWLSYRALESERAEALTADRAAREELARLAMWRLDSAAATLIAQENARPYFAYRPFYSAGEIRSGIRTAETPVSPLLPSPMLSAENPQVQLYFEVNALGEFSSPTVPSPEFWPRAVPAYLSAEKVVENRRRLEALTQLVSLDRLLAALPAADPPASVEPRVLAHLPSRVNASQGHPGARHPANQIAQSPEQQVISQSALNASEFQARSQFTLQNAANAPASNNLLTPTDVQMTVMRPLWLDGQLLLARRALLSGSELVQGCWLDWQTLKDQLQATIIDLLPDALLEPTDPAHAEERSHMMAVLPVELIPGEVAALTGTGWTPLRLSLWVAWCSLSLAAVAVAVMLQGVLALSERRAAFVSAVTHELRTPLTTFRMYVEMLAEGMVHDERSRSDYLETLRREADRLTHLVENVLAYARLERGRPGARIGPVRVAELLFHASDRLASRAAQAHFMFQVNAPPEVLNSEVVADPAAVEQILFNLVDNACKYARVAEDRAIELQIARDEDRVLLKLHDHGPGVADREQKRLFQPFRKSARDAADSAPGVGLGLALSRRMARDMGGELSLDSHTHDGACFVLILQAGATSMDATPSEPE